MRIAILFDRLDVLGGAERLAMEEARYFAQRKHCTTLLTYSAKMVLKEKGEINVIEMGFSNSLIQRFYVLLKALLHLKPDLIIAHPGSMSFLVFSVTRIVRVPYVLHIHGTTFWFPDDTIKYSFLHKSVFEVIRSSLQGHKSFVSAECHRRTIRQKITEEIAAIIDYLNVRNAVEVFTLSKRVRWEIQLLYRRDATVAVAGVDASLLENTGKIDVKRKLGIADKKMILSVSRLEPRKRFDLLLKSFGEIQKKDENAVLVIVGTGEDEQSLKTLAESLELGDKVIFTGFVPEDLLIEYYASCDLFVFPGWCAFGLVAIEARLFGKRVVITPDAVVCEVLVQDKGTVFSNPDQESLSETILRLLKMCENSEPFPESLMKKLTWNAYFGAIYSKIFLSISK
jgi:glycosyltransferase involved in cell wall biosynthesis